MIHGVLILAAGKGERFGFGSGFASHHSPPKQYHPLQGHAVLYHATATFLHHPAIHHLQLVIRDGDQKHYQQAMHSLALPPPVIGGETRQESVQRGLASLEKHHPPIDRILVHDGARPLVTTALIDRLLAALDHHKAAIPYLPIHDTIKERAPHHLVGKTLLRDTMVRVQTPQAFHFTALCDAHAHSSSNHLAPDDAAMLEEQGVPVALVEGCEHNLKITTPDDIALAEFYLRQKSHINCTAKT